MEHNKPEPPAETKGQQETTNPTENIQTSQTENVQTNQTENTQTSQP